MSKTITIPVSPNVRVDQALPSTSRLSVVDFGNSSPFDITYNGFGSPGDMIIEAGTKVRLHAEVLNTGKFSALPINNAGVSGTGNVNVTVYFVSDIVPPGTFPVAIPTQIVQATVSSVQTLSNETSTLGAEIIDIGTGTNTKMLDIFNDHFIWSVIQSAVAHQVLKGQASGNPLQLGQAGDITEILGKLLIDQIATVGPTAPPTGTGTTTVYEFTIGPFKIVAVQQKNVNNSSATQFTMALPTAFVSCCWVACGDTNNMELLNAGTPINLDVLVTSSSGSTFNRVSVTVLHPGNIAYAPLDTTGVDAPFDTLRFGASNANAHTGLSFIVGI